MTPCVSEKEQQSSRRSRKRQHGITSKCSLVNIGGDITLPFHAAAMVIGAKEILNIKASRSERADRTKKISRF